MNPPPPIPAPEGEAPRVVGIWRDRAFFVNDLSRVPRFDEVRLIDIRQCEALLSAEKQRGLRSVEEAVGKLEEALCLLKGTK